MLILLVAKSSAGRSGAVFDTLVTKSKPLGEESKNSGRSGEAFRKSVLNALNRVHALAQCRCELRFRGFVLRFDGCDSVLQSWVAGKRKATRLVRRRCKRNSPLPLSAVFPLPLPLAFQLPMASHSLNNFFSTPCTASPDTKKSKPGKTCRPNKDWDPWD